MGNESNAPLPSRRAPGRQQGPQAPAVARPAIADPVLERMRIAVEQERGRQDKTAQAVTAQPAPLAWFDADPNEDTAPQRPAISRQQSPPADRPASKQPWEDLLPAISRQQPAPANRPRTHPGDARQQTLARHGTTARARPAGDEIVSPARVRFPRFSTILIVALALVAAGSMWVALHRSAARAPGSSSASAAGHKISSMAAAWVVAQVSQQYTVGCDPSMCGELVAAGIHPDRLLELRSAAASPLAADVVVVTPAIRHLFGATLLAQDTPLNLASFGHGSSQVSVCLVAPNGAASLLANLAADLAARKASRSVLLSSSRITISPTGRAQLSAGLVDSRLLVVLARLAARYPIDIVAFTDSGPHASAGVPLRAAELAQSKSDPIVSASFAQSVRNFLGAQGAPYRPSSLRLAALSKRQTVLVVQFPTPSVLGLLNPKGG
jgi:hypothetical protein